MKRVASLAIITLLVMSGCENHTCDVPDEPQFNELEEQVIADCLILVAALDSFASENDGSCANMPEGYPVDVLYDSTCAKHSLVDLLPDQKLLVNPFTGSFTEPVDRRAENPGEIGYEPFRRTVYHDEHYNYSSHNPGYTITGYGKDSIIVVISNLDELEDSVRTNCYLVQQAVELWAQTNSGIYPSNIDVDSNMYGDTVIDLLPNGQLLKNPFTKYHTEPINGVAVTLGQVGYYPIADSAVNVGYTITGVGREPNVFVIELSNE